MVLSFVYLVFVSLLRLAAAVRPEIIRGGDPPPSGAEQLHRRLSEAVRPRGRGDDLASGIRARRALPARRVCRAATRCLTYGDGDSTSALPPPRRTGSAAD